jgi:hypothetical protein
MNIAHTLYRATFTRGRRMGSRPGMAPLITTDQLTIYLQDHRAGAQFGTELARRARDANEGTELGDFLAKLAEEIAEDRAALEDVMGRLGVPKDPLKIAGAWTAEKLGRLKLNGRLTSRAPLSTVIELEGLAAGVEGKLALWRSLEAIAPDEPRLDAAEVKLLKERAQRQLRGIHSHHKRAARAAFQRSAAAV